MPNHVENIIKMEGIINLPLFVEGDGEKSFDFNKIIPMPESLNIESGSSTDENIIYYITERCTIPIQCLEPEKKNLVKKLIKNMFSPREFTWAEEVFKIVMEKSYSESEYQKKKRYENGMICLSNYQQYNATTWYDWHCNNWGTKWNAYSYKQRNDNEISFQTAWSNPEPVMLRLSEMYPDATIEHWWADEDTGSNTGYRVYKCGKVIEGDYYEQCSNKAYETYIKCWGESNCLYQDEEGNWKRRDCETCHGCD
ncbi:hypothetical protein 10S8_30 [uncultured Caudovirales phage]|uniref:YubB ferredoxin-like domain-containing protein n=1 Tax=uncultured Caudovirales phage TaxID=2100421 RepID=A0A2H4JF84_9CAUD|nr:hypothetical protein 10S8_30 [uncultured Caudovirales phage]